jgi:hypothetical protein
VIPHLRSVDQLLGDASETGAERGELARLAGGRAVHGPHILMELWCGAMMGPL